MQKWYTIEISNHFLFEGKDIHNRKSTKILPFTLDVIHMNLEIQIIIFENLLFFTQTKLKNNNFMEWRIFPFLEKREKI